MLQTEVATEKGLDPFPPRKILGRTRKALVDLRRRVLERLGQKRLLGIEVRVKSPRREPRLRHHLVYARRMIPLSAKNPPRRGNDPGPRLRLLIGRVSHVAP